MTWTDGELFALLRPWHAALRAGCVGAAHDTSPVPSPLFSSDGSAPEGARVLWVSGKGDDVGPLAEALDLLALVARARASAVHYAVAQLWPHRLINWFDDEHEAIAPPPFVLGLSVAIHYVEDLETLGDWLTGLHDYSDDYVRVRELLDSSTSDSVDVAPVPVGVRCEKTEESPFGDGRFHEMLRSLVPLVMIQQRPRGESTLVSTIAARSAARFEIRQFEFGDIEMVITIKSLCYMGQLAEWGVAFNHLPAIRDKATTRCSAGVTRALHRLLAVPGQAARAARGVTTLAVLDDTPLEITLMVLSAAQVSTTLRHVRIKTTEERFGVGVAAVRYQLWRWIAYTTISSHANPLIKRLDPDVDDLTLGDVEQMGHIKKAQDPLREVLQRYNSDDCSPSWITSKRFYLADPRRQLDPTSPNKILTVDPAMQVRIVDALEPGSSWWTVLLPGRGLAWVKDDDAPQEDAEPPALGVAGSAATEIFLGNVLEADMAATSALLRLLGPTLQEVEADAINAGQLIDDWYNMLCTHCHQLDRIKFRDVSFMSTQTVIDSYASGACRASCLHLDGFESDLSPRHIQHFLDVLQDPQHAITQYVQDLRVCILIEDTEDLDIVDSLHRMLEQNPRLHSVGAKIYFDKPEFPRLDYKSIELSFAKYDTQQRTIRTGPLHIRRKIALLSVVQSKIDVGRGALQSLDSSVLTIVFQFAAPQRVRRVDVRMLPWN